MDALELLTRVLLFLFLLWWFFTYFLPQIIDFVFKNVHGGQPAIMLHLLSLI